MLVDQRKMYRSFEFSSSVEQVAMSTYLCAIMPTRLGCTVMRRTLEFGGPRGLQYRLILCSIEFDTVRKKTNIRTVMCAGADRHGEIPPQTGHASHRKSNSYAQAPSQRRTTDPRAPDRGRGRALIEAAKGNRWGHRDATMILVAYRHGLRVSELVDLRWDQIDFDTATLHVRRVKQGTPSHASDHGRRAARAAPAAARAGSQVAVRVHQSSAAAPFTTAGFARMVERAGEAARLGFKAHPHMLRHACGFALANKGHDTRALQAYLGHRNIQHTVRYTELSPTRFKDFWRS